MKGNAIGEILYTLYTQHKRSYDDKETTCMHFSTCTCTGGMKPGKIVFFIVSTDGIELSNCLSINTMNFRLLSP